LCIEHDSDKSLPRGGGGANVPDNSSNPVVRRVRHIQTKNIDPGLNQPGDHFFGSCSGPKRGDNFSFAHNGSF
jgi:hypothetical protein